MLLKCPFCGANIEHDPLMKESPVCPGCNLKLTNAGLQSVAPPVPPAADTNSTKSASPVESSSAPPSVLPSSPIPPPPVAGSAGKQPGSNTPVPPAEILAPPIIHPPVKATNAIASAPPVANPASFSDPVLADPANHEPKNEPRSENSTSSEPKSKTGLTSKSTLEPVPMQPAPVTAVAAEITPPEHTVLIPSPDGGFVPVDERFTHVEHRGKKIELLNVSHEKRHSSRRIRSTIIFVGCLIFLAGFMIWLSKYLQ